MPESPRLIDLALTSFADRLAERTPTPGGGSVAAYLAEMGCALGAMAFRFTSGEKFQAVEAAMKGRVETLERLRLSARELVDRDSRSYDAVSAAYKLPKATDAEKAARTAAIQAGLRGALEVPATTLATALTALEVLHSGLRDVNSNLASDAATGVWCLRGAAEAAFYNVRINAGSITDRAWAEERLGQARSALERVRALSDDGRAIVETRLS